MSSLPYQQLHPQGAFKNKFSFVLVHSVCASRVRGNEAATGK